ncbi:MAG: ferrous iron transporter B [Elusimicrobiota bacterium]
MDVHKIKKILLMGNPNVGKSVIFSRLTGVKVIASNYPGTTVEFTEGIMHIDHKDVKVIDVPGVYSLLPVSKAEEVAVKMLHESFKDDSGGTVVVNVIDATNLERNLNITLQLLKKNVPLVIALNFWDETRHTGIEINLEKLREITGVSCVPTCAITGEGIYQLVEEVKSARAGALSYEEGEKWNIIGNIIQAAQTIHHRHHTVFDRLGELTVKPLTGIPIAVLTALISFSAVRIIGEGLVRNIFDPFFEKAWAPVMRSISGMLGGEGIIHDIIIGKLIGGTIDFGQSFGMLTTGLYVPLAAVLPYIFAFYLVLSLLEDSGYLPRLAVLADNAMHRIGLHGYGIIPMILGFGCNVPGALATRIMETKRERFLAATIMAISVPCMAQIAMIAGLIGDRGISGFAPVFISLAAVWLLLGIILNKILKGHAPELFIEIPPYRMPYWKGVIKKVWMRVLWFLKEALPWVLTGVFIVNILYLSGIVDFISVIVRPVVSGIMGLPAGAVGALLIGFLRKDVAVGMLAPLGLSLKQLIIASVVLTMYFPCVATFTVMIKEFGILDMLKASLIMLISTLVVSGILNIIL